MAYGVPETHQEFVLTFYMCLWRYVRRFLSVYFRSPRRHFILLHKIGRTKVDQHQQQK